MVTGNSILQALDTRRKALGLSCAAIAREAGISLRTAQRVMSGDDSNVTLSTLTRVADVLGVRLGIASIDLNVVRKRRAEVKARRLVGLVQGTMGLEAAAVDYQTLSELHQQTVRDLLRGSNRRLWED